MAFCSCFVHLDGSRIQTASLGVSSRVPAAPPHHGLAPCRLRWGWRAAKNTTLFRSKQASSLRPWEGRAFNSHVPGCSGSGGCWLQNWAHRCGAQVRTACHRNAKLFTSELRNAVSGKQEFIFVFCQHGLWDQHKRGAISMVFTRRTVCGFTITGRETTGSQLGHI